MSFDAEVGGRGGERPPLVGQIAGARPELVGPDEHVLEALGLVPGEVGWIGVGGAHVDGERTGLPAMSRSSTTRSRSRTASSNEGVPELNQPSPAVAARRSARSVFPPRISGTLTGAGESCTLPNENSWPSCEITSPLHAGRRIAKRLVHPGGTVVEGHAERVELLLQPPGPDPEEEAAAGDVLQCEGHAGGEQRVTEGKDEDPGRQAQVGGDAGARGEGDEWVEQFVSRGRRSDPCGAGGPCRR